MNNLFRSIIKALLICVITGAVLIFIFGAVAAGSSDSTKNLSLFGKAAFLLSALAGSLAAARAANTKPFVASMIFCGIFLALSLTLSLLLGGGAAADMWIMYLGVLGICILGAVIGSYKKPKKPKRLKELKRI